MKERPRNFQQHLSKLKPEYQDDLMETLANMGQLNDVEVTLEDGSVIQTSPQRAEIILQRQKK